MKLNQTLLSLCLCTAIFYFSSCLKDLPATADFSVSKPVIEQLNSSNFFNLAVNNGSDAANLNSYFMELRVDSSGAAIDSVTINVAGTLIANDVTVNLGTDANAFSNFNAANGDTLLMLPANTYTITTPQVTIKANTRNVIAYIKFNTTLIDFTKTYYLPLSITSVAGAGLSGNGISANYGTVLYALVPGNKYMGLYQSVGARLFNGFTFGINDAKYLFDLSGICAYQHQFPTAYGAPSKFLPNLVVANCADQTIYLSIGQQMDLHINPLTDSVKVTDDNVYYFGVELYNLVSGPSYYDEANHTFHLSYGYVDPYSGDSATISETLTRVR
jgi:hypothetical protein